MTSTPVVLLLKRSGQASDRPNTSVIQNGELAIAVGAADPGLYFEDSAGVVRKIGPSAYGTTAPNSTPVGLAGNSVGETWADSSTSNYFFKVWTGSSWQTIGAAYATAAGSASSATTAGFATAAGSAVIASGVVQAATVVVSGLPAVSTSLSGSLVYQVQTSGAFSAGLYVRASNTWLLV
jgi:hypothetical protein